MLPRLIHRIWIGTSPMPPLMVAWGERWRSLNPDWELLLWSENGDTLNCGRSPRTIEPSPTQRDLLNHACHLSQRSNIWRYLLIEKYGGLYVDTDVEPYRPIDDLVDNKKALVARRHSPSEIRECAFFGAVPGHAWTKHLVIELDTCNPTTSLSMGADYFTRITTAHPDVHVLGENEVFSMFPNPWSSARYSPNPDLSIPSPPSSYARHHWSSLWFPKGFQEHNRPQ